MKTSLTNRVALITGAASGIGLRIAEVLAEAGARVVVADKDPGVNDVARRLGGTAVVTDLTRAEAVASMIDQCLATHQHLDILINNAGIDGAQAPLTESSDANWKAVMDINLDAVYWGLRYGLKPMIAQQSGVILNMASISGLVGFPNLTAYSASKGAVIQLTRCAAMEAAPHRIRVNALCPSVVQTPLVEHFISTSADPEATRAWFQQFNPLPGMVTTDAVADAALFLVSDASEYITGVALPIDGGYTAR